MSYFSARELHNYITRNSRGQHYHTDYINQILGRGSVNRPVTLKDVQKALPRIKKIIAARQVTPGNWAITKWYRPWVVVPKLANFAAPAGDFGIGFEIELGFTSLANARKVAKHVINWKYITLDFEGGDNPIELTFPPILYSKLSKRSQVMRYCKFLTDNDRFVTKHAPGRLAGIHVNVSLPLGDHVNSSRMELVNDVLTRWLSYDQKEKYFGRNPYGYGNTHDSGGRYLEWKLFHSTTDAARLRQYADIAVELTKLVGNHERDTSGINTQSVLAALETGYNRSLSRKKKVASVDVATPLYSLAA